MVGVVGDESNARVAPRERKLSRDWSLVVFVISLGVLAFLYGAVSSELRLPPSQQVRQAIYAAKAIKLYLTEGDLPSGAIRLDESADPDRSVRQLDAAAGKELLLVTGGPNRDGRRCPEFGCLASVIDRSGRVLHAWPLPLDALFKDVRGFRGDVKLTNFYPIGLGLLRDGSLIATFHARNTYPYVVGIARISWTGQVMWKHIDGAHHWIRIGPDDHIYAPSQVRRKLTHVAGNVVELQCPDVVYDEGVRIYRPDGTVERTVSMLELLARNGYAGLLYSVRSNCDPIHLNSVDLATPEIAARIPGVEAGDVLVSLREPSAIVLFNPISGKVKRVTVGRTAAQHSARFLPDGSVIAFDNQGGTQALGGSRIMRLNLIDGSAQVLFPTAASKSMLPFFSEDGGTVIPSPDGKRAMISSKDQSRDIEFDLATGRPLWEMTQVFDVAPFIKKDGKKVAGYFTAYGTYYLTDEEVRSLPLH